MPQFDLFPEADIADMEAFLDEIQLVLPVIGADYLRKPPSNAGRKPPNAILSEMDETSLEDNAGNPIFVVNNDRAGIKGRAREEDGEFIILAGSVGSLKERSSFIERYQTARVNAFETKRARKK